MLNTDERLYYAGAGDTLKTLLIHIYQEEAYKRQPEDKSIEQDFANRAKQIATSVRDAYLALLDVPLPQHSGSFDTELAERLQETSSIKIAGRQPGEKGKE